MTENTISGVHVHVSPGSGVTLVRRGGITNHHLIAHSLSNISAKNYHNRLMCVEVTVCNISVVFFETQCRARYTSHTYSYRKDLANKNVFKCLLSAGNKDDTVTEAGKLFHAQAAITCNEWSPTV